MKKKLGILLFSLFLTVLLTSCGEVLSVVTAGKDGEKVVNNYISILNDKVYDETASFKSWKDVTILDDEDVLELDDLLFKIVNKKDQIVVLGDEDAAVEISFFEGGYKYTVFTSMESLNHMFD